MDFVVTSKIDQFQLELFHTVVAGWMAMWECVCGGGGRVNKNVEGRMKSPRYWHILLMDCRVWKKVATFITPHFLSPMWRCVSDDAYGIQKIKLYPLLSLEKVVQAKIKTRRYD